MLSLPFELLLALRYLRPKRTFFSIITLISVMGVMLGVAVLIIVISVMSGFDQSLRDKILGFNSHLRVSTVDRKVKNYRELANVVSANPNVKGVAPYVLGQVLIKTQPSSGEPVYLAQYLRGVDPALEGKVTSLTNSMIAGAFDLRGNRIVIGSGCANDLRLHVGDRLLIYAPRDVEKWDKARTADEADIPVPDDYEIAGIFEVGYYEYDSSYIITSLGNAQDLYELQDSVHGLMVMINNPNQAASVRNEVAISLPEKTVISTWMDDARHFLEALAVEKNVMFYLLFFIMVVAAFGIMSALITFVVQKTKEIGVLKALGAQNSQVMLIFLSQSCIVGVLGVCSGLGLGLLALSYRNEFLFLMRRITGVELFPEQIYAFRELPMVIVPRDILLICLGSLLACFVAGLLPAWNAGRLKPVEALRAN